MNHNYMAYKMPLEKPLLPMNFYSKTFEKAGRSLRRPPPRWPFPAPHIRNSKCRPFGRRTVFLGGSRGMVFFHSKQPYLQCLQNKNLATKTRKNRDKELALTLTHVFFCESSFFQKSLDGLSSISITLQNHLPRFHGS